jgi:bla regulator protein BlaR1
MTAALLNHLWQSTAFAAAAALLAWALRGHQARVRFWIWMAASLKFLLPFGALIAAGEWLGARLWPLAGGGPATNAAAARLMAVTAPFQRGFTPPAALPPGAAALPAAASLPLGAWLGAVAAAGSVALLARWAWRWQAMARLARAGEAREIGGLPARVTQATAEPGVFGILRPVLLLPRGLEARLSAEQLAAVLAHERCHMRRRDNLWSALHMLVETLFWFHPLVWWIGGRLVAERERACDEAVLDAGGDRAAYAGGLLAVCRFYVESPLRCAAGVGGGGLSRRVREVLDGRHRRRLSRRLRWALAAVGALALLGPLAAGMLAAPAAAAADARMAFIKLDQALPQPRFRATLRFTGGHISAQGVPLKDLVQLAYGLQPYQVAGPGWLARERFDVNSVLVRSRNAGARQALRGLLKLRFALAAHAAVRVMRVFQMRVAPGGPKLMRAAGGQDLFYTSVGPQGVALSGEASMPRLAAMLSSAAGLPLVDATALRGNYRVQLHWAPRLALPGLGMGGAAAMEPVPAGPVAIKLLAAALQRQLGLRLEPERMPVRILIVDHIDKEPSR